jgi:hypothetical protein
MKGKLRRIRSATHRRNYEEKKEKILDKHCNFAAKSIPLYLDRKTKEYGNLECLLISKLTTSMPSWVPGRPHAGKKR